MGAPVGYVVIDGDGNGTSGDAYRLQGNAVNRLYQLTADWSGDNGSTAFDLRLALGAMTYRAFRFPWRGNLLVTDSESLDFGVVGPGETATLPLSPETP